MKRYQSYKDSGVEWIGEIPKGWDIKRIGSVFTERRETVSDKLFPPLSVSKNGVVPQMEGVAKTDNNDNRKLVEINDFVINSRSDRKGSSGISLFEGSVSVINIVLTPKKVIPKYSNYLFKSYHFIEEFFKNGRGIVMDLWSTRYSDMKYMVIPLPPLSEQTQIVSYLDRKTEWIDNLIQTKVRKIELLKEYRTSLISKVVTKGLNPNVEMKDSGVEWIGEIPEHWVNSKLGFFITKIGSGSTPRGGSEVYVDEGIPFIRSQNVHFKGLVLEGISFIEVNTHQTMLGSKVEKGDVLLNITGGSIGRCCVVKSDYEMNLNQHVSIIRTKYTLNNFFLNYILQSEIGQLQVRYNISGGNREGLTIEGIRDFQVTVPPLSEQTQIVSYLDEQTQLIDKNIQTEEKKIELLKEYRQSLISEVVTGKIKVCNDEEVN